MASLGRVNPGKPVLGIFPVVLLCLACAQDGRLVAPVNLEESSRTDVSLEREGREVPVSGGSDKTPTLGHLTADQPKPPPVSLSVRPNFLSANGRRFVLEVTSTVEGPLEVGITPFSWDANSHLPGLRAAIFRADLRPGRFEFPLDLKPEYLTADGTYLSIGPGSYFQVRGDVPQGNDYDILVIKNPDGSFPRMP